MAVSYFLLGANSPTGFYSLYDQLIDRNTARSVYILKGGPGCGKSTFLRRIARHGQTAGFDTQFILCSGDPDSLDAVVFPQLHIALVDGTAPHVVEPLCPGAVDHYINLGECYQSEQLQPLRSEILAQMSENKAAYRRCYRCLHAVGELRSDLRELLVTSELTARFAKRAKGIVSREFKRDGGQEGAITQRFLSAVTCRGRIVLWDTISQYKRIYELSDGLGLAHELLLPIATLAAARGYNLIACPDPLAPDRLEHLLVPSLGLAFLSVEKGEEFPGKADRRLRLDSVATSADPYRKNRGRVRFSQKVSAALLDEATQALGQAKEAHDRLERLYNPYVDFDSVTARADALAQKLFPEGAAINNRL